MWIRSRSLHIPEARPSLTQTAGYVNGTKRTVFTGNWWWLHDIRKMKNSSVTTVCSEAGRVQIRRKGLDARFLIRNKAQSPRILDQVAQFISHWKTVSDGSAIDRSVNILAYEGHSVNSEIRYVSAIAYLLAESWCCLYKAPTFISHNSKETIS